MKAKTLEIFRSIQGEGKYAGVTQVFVRFFECNMHCVWCDTPHSIGDTTRKYDEKDLEDVCANIDSLYDGVHSVSLTGGEPLLQADAIKAMIPHFKAKEQKTYLDTNGTLPDELKKVIDGIDIIAMDIKLPSSTETCAYWDEHQEFIKIARNKDLFIKTVISSKTDMKDVLRAAEIVAAIDPEILFILQPNYFDMQNGVVKRCTVAQEVCRDLKNVRILPQMHKMLKVR